MGQQQLLLTVLGVIIVGVAVIVGLNLFAANARLGEIDNISIEAQAIAQMAIHYFNKPKSTGGGGRSFYGFRPPSQLTTDITGYNDYNLVGLPISTLTGWNYRFFTNAGVYIFAATTDEIVQEFQITCKSHNYPYRSQGYFFISVNVKMVSLINKKIQISTSVYEII